MVVGLRKRQRPYYDVSIAKSDSNVLVDTSADGGEGTVYSERSVHFLHEVSKSYRLSYIFSLPESRTAYGYDKQANAHILVVRIMANATVGANAEKLDVFATGICAALHDGRSS